MSRLNKSVSKTFLQRLSLNDYYNYYCSVISAGCIRNRYVRFTRSVTGMHLIHDTPIRKLNEI